MVFIGFLLIWSYFGLLMKFTGLVTFTLISLGVLHHDVLLLLELEFSIIE
jgi:hypothetical protein